MIAANIRIWSAFYFDILLRLQGWGPAAASTPYFAACSRRWQRGKWCKLNSCAIPTFVSRIRLRRRSSWTGILRAALPPRCYHSLFIRSSNPYSSPRRRPPWSCWGCWLNTTRYYYYCISHIVPNEQRIAGRQQCFITTDQYYLYYHKNASWPIP